jgi:hypothetical protein
MRVAPRLGTGSPVIFGEDQQIPLGKQSDKEAERAGDCTSVVLGKPH